MIIGNYKGKWVQLYSFNLYDWDVAVGALDFLSKKVVDKEINRIVKDYRSN